MEGKELHNEDDELKSGSPEESQEESDDFGLPDADTSSENESTPEEEESEPLDFSTEPETDSYFGGTDDDNSAGETGGYQYHADRDDNRSPVGLIISMIIIGVIVVAIAIYWFFFREAPQKVVEQPVAVQVEDPPAAMIEEPQAVVEEEPQAVVEEPSDESVEEGLVQTINAPTGRYYIVINSFFDGDLAVDYANQLAVDGFDSKILAPSEKTGFHRVVIDEEFGTWQDAEANKAQFKEVFGEDIWVLKF